MRDALQALAAFGAFPWGLLVGFLGGQVVVAAVRHRARRAVIHSIGVVAVERALVPSEVST